MKKNYFNIYSTNYNDTYKRFNKCNTLKKLKEIYTYDKIQKIYNDYDFVDLHINDIESILKTTPNIINGKYYFNNKSTNYKYMKSIECNIDSNNVVIVCNIYNRHFL